MKGQRKWLLRGAIVAVLLTKLLPGLAAEGEVQQSEWVIDAAQWALLDEEIRFGKMLGETDTAYATRIENISTSYYLASTLAVESGDTGTGVRAWLVGVILNGHRLGLTDYWVNGQILETPGAEKGRKRAEKKNYRATIESIAAWLSNGLKPEVYTGSVEGFIATVVNRSTVPENEVLSRSDLASVMVQKGMPDTVLLPSLASVSGSSARTEAGQERESAAEESVPAPPEPVDYLRYVQDVVPDGTAIDPRNGAPIVSLRELDKFGRDWEWKNVTAVFTFSDISDTWISILPGVTVASNGLVSRVRSSAYSEWIGFYGRQHGTFFQRIFATAASKSILRSAKPEKTIFRCGGTVVPLEHTNWYGLICTELNVLGEWN